MIQQQTRMRVADNSGAKEVMCIKVLGGSKRRTASVGDIVVVSIKSALPTSKSKKGEVAKSGDRAHSKADPQTRRFIYSIRRQCSCVDQRLEEPVGTRIFGPVARELRAKQFVKIVSLAPEVL